MKKNNKIQQQNTDYNNKTKLNIYCKIKCKGDGMWFSKKKYSDRIRTQQAIFFDVLSVSNLYFFYVFGTVNSPVIPTEERS